MAQSCVLMLKVIALDMSYEKNVIMQLLFPSKEEGSASVRKITQKVMNVFE